MWTQLLGMGPKKSDSQEPTVKKTPRYTDLYNEGLKLGKESTEALSNNHVLTSRNLSEECAAKIRSLLKQEDGHQKRRDYIWGWNYGVAQATLKNELSR